MRHASSWYNTPIRSLSIEKRGAGRRCSLATDLSRLEGSTCLSANTYICHIADANNSICAACRLSSAAYAAIACLAVEYVGLFMGVSLFLRTHNCLYIILHFAGAIVTGLMYTQVSATAVLAGVADNKQQLAPSESDSQNTAHTVLGPATVVQQQTHGACRRALCGFEAHLLCFCHADTRCCDALRAGLVSWSTCWLCDSV